MESRRNGPQLSSRHDDDDDDEGWKAELTLLLGNAAAGSRTRDLSVPNPTA